MTKDANTEDTGKRRGHADIRVSDSWYRTGRRIVSVLSVSSVLLFTVSSVFPSVTAPPAPAAQSITEAESKSSGCMSCHTTTDRHTMHQNPGVVLGCTD